MSETQIPGQSAPENPEEFKVMTLGQHLSELRKRLVVSIVTVLAALFLFLLAKDPLTDVIMAPYRAAWYRTLDTFYENRIVNDLALKDRDTLEKLQRDKLDFWETYYPKIRDQRLTADEEQVVADNMPRYGFKLPYALLSITLLQDVFVWMSTAFVAAVVLSAPVILHQMWKFIGAGLYVHERRVIMRFVPLSVLLFVAGVAFGYLVMVPQATYWLLNLMNPANVQGQITIRDYFSFLFTLTAALGVVFQLPLVMVALVKVGIVQPEFYTKYWRHAVVAIFIVCAVLTPPDPFTQSMMALPMCGLYVLGVVLARAVARRAKAAESVAGVGSEAEAEVKT
jgi:Tat protein translocase TatC